MKINKLNNILKGLSDEQRWELISNSDINGFADIVDYDRYGTLFANNEDYFSSQLTSYGSPYENIKDINSLHQYPIKYFYHITHIDNIENILINGLYSKNFLDKQNIEYSSILDKHNGLEEVRTDNINCKNFTSYSYVRNYFIDPIYKRPLNDYVPLYINPQGPILNIDRQIQDDFVVLCINKNIIKDPLAIFSDGFPTNAQTNFYERGNDINKLRWNVLLDRNNRINCFKGLSYLYPEVFVRLAISSGDIEKIICQKSYISNKTARILNNISSNKIPIEENREFFFMSGASMDTKYIFNLE